MACVVQIGAGGVGGVVAHKMAMNREVFSHIVLASRTIEKCHAIAESIRAKGLGEIVVDSVDADSVDSVVGLIQKHKPKLVINVALPYQDLAIMEACLQTGVHYLDTANYEHPDSAHFEYKEQWAYDTRFKQAGLFALLGSGFDPGVTNVFCAYAQKHYFDEIESIDILDCNAGDHGYAFATNFNPEINLREVSSKARYWVRGDSSLTQSLNECCNSASVTTDKVAPSPHFAQHSNLTQDTRIAESGYKDSSSVAESTTSDSHSLSESAPSVIASERSEAWQSIKTDSEKIDCHADKSARNDDKTEFATHASLESPTDSKNPNPLVSPTDLAFNPDLQQDTIYRKFEREEQHWRAEVEQKEREREAESRNDWGGNSKIFDEKCGLQEKGRGSYLEGNDRSTFSPLPHLSQKAEFPYCGGEWRDIAPLALMKEWDYPEVGVKNSYLLYHEELESLVRNIRGLKRIRFFMTFGESYLTHMKCLENIGFLRIDEVAHKGGKIVPIEVLKTLLPDPASLAPRTKGQTHIGCYIKGRKDGKERTIYIYNICEHESCYKEVNAQGVSYTTGVPAMIGAKLICEGKWGLNQPKTPSSADNSDMPQGGEYQGIDNAAELCAMVAKGRAGGACETAAESKEQSSGTTAESKKQTDKDARNSKIFDEKCGLQEKGRGSYLEGNDRSSFSPLPHLSQKAEFQGAGVWNMEQNDPDPFMRELNLQGLPYIVVEIESSGRAKVLEDGRKQI